MLPLALASWRLDEAAPEPPPLVRTHLDSALVVPIFLSLCAFERPGSDAPSVVWEECREEVDRFLEARGLTDGSGAWTPDGEQIRSLAAQFGMAASCLPLLSRLPGLCRGLPPPRDVPRSARVARPEGAQRQRSGAAHVRCFKDAERIFVDVFDREPSEAQPRFIADMGCRDANWLTYLHALVTARTRRGRHIARHPLLMVGLDYNEAALVRARENSRHMRFRRSCCRRTSAIRMLSVAL